MKRLHLKDAILVCQGCDKPIGRGHFYTQLWIEVGGNRMAWHLNCDDPKSFPRPLTEDRAKIIGSPYSCPDVQRAENEGLPVKLDPVPEEPWMP